MPKEKEEQLKRQAVKKGLTGERKDAYVYGTLRDMGWKPEREKKAKHGLKQMAKHGKK